MRIIKSEILKEKPFIKGIIKKIKTLKPKKPNSALRKVALVTLPSLSNKEIWVYIPGIKHNLKTHTEVLIKGGRTKDLPGLKYKIERNKRY